MLVRSVFDPSKDTLRRHQEEVITYSAAADSRVARLRAEMAVTIATDSMKAQFKEMCTNTSCKPVGEAAGAFCPFRPNQIART